MDKAIRICAFCARQNMCPSPLEKVTTSCDDWIAVDKLADRCECARGEKCTDVEPEKPLLKKCKTCRFERVGFCCRFPPRATKTGGRLFPHIGPDDWCGEWEERRG